VELIDLEEKTRTGRKKGSRSVAKMGLESFFPSFVILKKFLFMSALYSSEEKV
jgi:hypothetical protein